MRAKKSKSIEEKKLNKNKNYCCCPIHCNFLQFISGSYAVNGIHGHEWFFCYFICRFGNRICSKPTSFFFHFSWSIPARRHLYEFESVEKVVQSNPLCIPYTQTQCIVVHNKEGDEKHCIGSSNWHCWQNEKKKKNWDVVVVVVAFFNRERWKVGTFFFCIHFFTQYYAFFSTTSYPQYSLEMQRSPTTFLSSQTSISNFSSSVTLYILLLVVFFIQHFFFRSFRQ